VAVRPEEPAGDAPSVPSLIVVTGMSGAGRSEAARALEDIGTFVVDNMPPALVGKMLDLATAPGSALSSIALVMDVRGGAYFDQVAEALAELERRGIEYRILFLDAGDEVLLRRYELNRRAHPLADPVVDGIRRERALLRSLRERADLTIDTSAMTVQQLRARIVKDFSPDARTQTLRTSIVSFGFKHGVPTDADMVLDVRFLPNPHWVDELRPFDGTSVEVRDYVLSSPHSAEFLDRIRALFDTLVPGFLAEGKRYLTVAIGCTGGKHRSVVIADEVGAMLAGHGLPVDVRHRDIARE